LFSGREKLLIGLLAAITLAVVIALAAMVVGLVNRSAGVLLGDEQAPVAAVMIFDTSPHMEYRHQNQTRSEVARDMGDWLIGQFPPESEVAVLDSRQAPAVFAVDLASARKAIDRLQTTEVSQPLPSVLRRALSLVAASEKTRKEIYLFTDLVGSAWQDPAGELAKALEEHTDVLLYVIDVGVVAPNNVALGPLELSAETLASSNELRVTTRVQGVGAAGPQVVQLLLEDFDPTLPIVIEGETKLPEMRPRGREEVTLAADEPQRVEFRLRGLDAGLHHGIVRLGGDDGLDADNLRHFAIEVKAAWPILVVAAENATASLFTEAIAPFEFEQTGQARSPARWSHNRASRTVTWTISRQLCCWTPSRFRRSSGSSLASMFGPAAGWLYSSDTMHKPPRRSTNRPPSSCLADVWLASGVPRIAA